MDPGITAALVAGTVAIITAALGFRSKREEAALSGLQTLITALQEDQRQNRLRIETLEQGRRTDRQEWDTHRERMELALEERDSEIDRLRLDNRAKDLEIERLTTLHAHSQARITELEGEIAGRRSLDAALWEQAEGAG